MNWLIVEDHPMFKDKIIQDLSSTYQHVSIFAANNGLEALEVFKKKKIELLITDIQMSGMDGLELSEIIRRERKEVKIMFFTNYNDLEYIHKSVALDAHAYVLKTTPFLKLVSIIDRVLKGETYYDKESLKILGLGKYVSERLSERQLEVVKLLCQGKSAPEIAKELNIAVGTVKIHRSKVYNTLGFNHITQLTSWAIKHKVI